MYVLITMYTWSLGSTDCLPLTGSLGPSGSSCVKSVGGSVGEKKMRMRDHKTCVHGIVGVWKCDMSIYDSAQSSSFTRRLNHLENCITFISQIEWNYSFSCVLELCLQRVRTQVQTSLSRSRRWLASIWQTNRGGKPSQLQVGEKTSRWASKQLVHKLVGEPGSYRWFRCIDTDSWKLRLQFGKFLSKCFGFYGLK